MNTTDGAKVLVRSRKDRMAAGICAGAASYFGWDLISKTRHGSPG